MLFLGHFRLLPVLTSSSHPLEQEALQALGPQGRYKEDVTGVPRAARQGGWVGLCSRKTSCTKTGKWGWICPSPSNSALDCKFPERGGTTSVGCATAPQCFSCHVTLTNHLQIDAWILPFLPGLWEGAWDEGWEWGTWNRKEGLDQREYWYWQYSRNSAREELDIPCTVLCS